MDKSKRSTVISLIYSIAILFFEACYLLPSAKLYFDITRVSVISLGFALIAFEPKLKFKIIPKTFLIALPFLILRWYVAFQGDFWNGFLHPLLLLWFTLFPAFLCYDVMNNGGKIEIPSASLFFLTLFLFVGYNTIGQLQYDENILRILTSGAEGEEFAIEMALNNNGGFGFVYAAGVLFVAILAILINVDKVSTWWRVALIAINVLLFVIVTSAQFTTLLLLVIIMSFLVVLFKVNRQYWIFLIVLSPLIIFGIPYLLDILISYYSGSVTGDHLVDLSNSIAGSEPINGATNGRSRLMYSALRASLYSPLWGQSVIGTAAGQAAHSCHSVVLTNLVETGLIGVFFKYRSIRFAATSSIKKIDLTLCQRILYPTLLYFLLLSILNPIEQIGDINMTVFFCIPILLALVSKQCS